jgi:hypothetical protein
VGGTLGDLDGPLGLGERLVDVAVAAGRVAPNESEEAVSVAVAGIAEDLLRPAEPAARDGLLAHEGVLAGDVEGQVAGPDLVALQLAGLEGPFLDLDALLGAGREERGLRQRLEVVATEPQLAVGAAEELEGVVPAVPGKGLATGDERVVGRGVGWGADLGHRHDCATVLSGPCTIGPDGGLESGAGGA